MLIFWRLLLSHLIADFTLQTDLVARLKRSVWWGMPLHCLTHLATNILLTYPYLNEQWVDLPFLNLRGWESVFIIFLLHYAQDMWRIFTIRKLNTTDGTVHFIWDQVVHIGILFMFSPIIGFAHSGSPVHEKWVLLLILFVIVTHAGTVLIYFIERDLYAIPFPHFDVKYMSMTTRLILWLFFLIPGTKWIIFSILWAGFIAYLEYKRIVDFSKINLAAGLTITVACGLLARLVLYG